VRGDVVDCWLRLAGTPLHRQITADLIGSCP
jgi:hypothetical protein